MTGLQLGFMMQVMISGNLANFQSIPQSFSYAIYLLLLFVKMIQETMSKALVYSIKKCLKFHSVYGLSAGSISLLEQLHAL